MPLLIIWISNYLEVNTKVGNKIFWKLTFHRTPTVVSKPSLSVILIRDYFNCNIESFDVLVRICDLKLWFWFLFTANVVIVIYLYEQINIYYLGTVSDFVTRKDHCKSEYRIENCFHLYTAFTSLEKCFQLERQKLVHGRYFLACWSNHGKYVLWYI